MSLTVSTDVFCDGYECTAWVHGSTGIDVRARDARVAAKRAGWDRVKVRYDDGSSEYVDLCPECLATHRSES